MEFIANDGSRNAHRFRERLITNVVAVLQSFGYIRDKEAQRRAEELRPTGGVFVLIGRVGIVLSHSHCLVMLAEPEGLHRVLPVAALPKFDCQASDSVVGKGL